MSAKDVFQFPLDLVDRMIGKVLRPFQIPKDWLRFRAGDWGSAKPFSFGWYAVASEPNIAGPGILIPRGAMIRYKEYYGVATDGDGKFIPNKGVKMPTTTKPVLSLFSYKSGSLQSLDAAVAAGDDVRTGRVPVDPSDPYRRD